MMTIPLPPPLLAPTLLNPHAYPSFTVPPIPPYTPCLPWTFHTTPSLFHPQQPYLYPSNQLPQKTQLTYTPNQELQPSQNLKPIPQSKPTYPKSSEVRGNSFRIDSKIFSLGFDGGKVDLYHIMERKGRFQGSIWLGIKWL